MASLLIFTSVLATISLLVVPIFVLYRQKTLQAKRESTQKEVTESSAEISVLVKKLASGLPDSIILPHDSAFEESLNCYWAQQECEGMLDELTPLASPPQIIGSLYTLRRNLSFLSTNQSSWHDM